jgi:hypothetical protein
MDRLNEYREIVKRILSQYVGIRYANADLTNETVFDRENDRYLVVSYGWQGVRQMHGTLIHVDINDGKIWVHRDGTEYGIANEFVDAGIPKDQIVLGFHSPQVRPHTGFAVA